MKFQLFGRGFNMEWYLKVLKNYVVFQGRARRKEYWMFVLINSIISVILMVVEEFAGLSGVLSGIYYLAVFLPSLALGIRRLHDTGRSGWWLLLGIIPFIGAIILIIFACQDSQPGDNQYGPNPKIAV
jgi:uncharacterized membrane protein YhaH (DUF805 family)